MYNYVELPEGVQGGMQRYIEHGIEAGHFLTNVLANDLVGALTYADPANLKALPNIVKWLYNEAPVGAWGNVEKVRAWQGIVEEESYE